MVRGIRISNITFSPFSGYESDVSKLNEFTAVVDGGLDIFFNRNSKTFKDFLRAKGLPYAGRYNIFYSFYSLYSFQRIHSAHGPTDVAEKKQTIRYILVRPSTLGSIMRGRLC